MGFGERPEAALLTAADHLGDAARLADGGGCGVLVAVPLTWAAATAIAAMPRLTDGEGVALARAKDELLLRVDREARERLGDARSLGARRARGARPGGAGHRVRLPGRRRAPRARGRGPVRARGVGGRGRRAAGGTRQLTRRSGRDPTSLLGRCPQAPHRWRRSSSFSWWSGSRWPRSHARSGFPSRCCWSPRGWRCPSCPECRRSRSSPSWCSWSSWARCCTWTATSRPCASCAATRSRSGCWPRSWWWPPPPAWPSSPTTRSAWTGRSPSPWAPRCRPPTPWRPCRCWRASRPNRACWP